MAVNKMLLMLPVMLAARKLDASDAKTVFALRCSYFGVQSVILLLVIYIFLTALKLSKSKHKDVIIYVPYAAPQLFPTVDQNAKKQYKKIKFGDHIFATARSLLISTIFGICMTAGLHFYKGMIVGLAMQSLMAPFNLMDNTFAKNILAGGSFKEEDTPEKRKMFDEKYIHDLTPQDEIIDEDGNVVIVASSEGGSKETKNLTSAPKTEKSFEDILLDTWDEGSDADVTPFLEKLTKDNVNFRTVESGWTPLMIMSAINVKDIETVLDKLKNFDADCKITDEEGWNALHWAAFHGSAAGAKYILSPEGFDGIKNGLHLVRDKEDKDALYHARSEGNDDVVKIIEEAMLLAGSSVTDGIATQEGLRKRK